MQPRIAGVSDFDTGHRILLGPVSPVPLSEYSSVYSPGSLDALTSVIRIHLRDFEILTPIAMQQGKGQEERVTDNFENCPLGTVKNPDRVSGQSGPVIAEISDFPTKS